MEKFETPASTHGINHEFFLFSLKKLNYNNRLQTFMEISFFVVVVVGCVFVFLRVLKRNKTKRGGN